MASWTIKTKTAWNYGFCEWMKTWFWFIKSLSLVLRNPKGGVDPIVTQRLVLRILLVDQPRSKTGSDGRPQVMMFRWMIENLIWIWVWLLVDVSLYIPRNDNHNHWDNIGIIPCQWRLCWLWPLLWHFVKPFVFTQSRENCHSWTQASTRN